MAKFFTLSFLKWKVNTNQSWLPWTMRCPACCYVSILQRTWLKVDWRRLNQVNLAPEGDEDKHRTAAAGRPKALPFSLPHKSWSLRILHEMGGTSSLPYLLHGYIYPQVSMQHLNSLGEGSVFPSLHYRNLEISDAGFRGRKNPEWVKSSNICFNAQPTNKDRFHIT